MRFSSQVLQEYADGHESQLQVPLQTQAENSYESHGFYTRLDTSAALVNQSLPGDGGRIEASELSGILRQIDNSCFFNTEKPNSMNISTSQAPYAKAVEI